MNISRLAGLVAGLVVLALAPAVAQAAPAQAPGDVYLRVQGLSHAFPRSVVTTTTTPITRDGHDCSGTTDGGALDKGIGGANYAVHYVSPYGFSLDSVYGEALGFDSPAFWAILVNGQPNFGFCSSELAPGDDVVYYAACNTYYAGPAGPCYGDPLRITTAVPAKVAPGTAITVHVDEATIDPNANTASYAASSGATVTVGNATATTDASGNATITVADRGELSVKVTKGTRLDDSRPTCSTDGADGFCATVKPSVPNPILTPAGPDKIPAASRLTAVTEGKKYTAADAPRELKGTATDPSGILMVKLRLTRNDGGKCSYFSGRKLEFRTMRCGARNGKWFKIGTTGNWSYLLPEKLPKGRYVLDVNAIDKAYNRDDKLRRGSNRVVFTVA